MMTAAKISAQSFLRAMKLPEAERRKMLAGLGARAMTKIRLESAPAKVQTVPAK